MKTEQEQIEEIAKYVCSACEMGHGFDGCSYGGREHYKRCSITQKTAKKLYNAGYQKIDDLKAENKQLKTECALLDDELRIARQETIDVLNKVKERAVGLAAIETYHICNLIDELLKEYKE